MSRCVGFVVLVACGGGPGPSAIDAPSPTAIDAPLPAPDQAVAPAADWVLAVAPERPAAGQLSPALLGHYDLSGSLLDYRGNATLIDRMKAIGFTEWRVGLGRWEFAT